MWAELFTYVRPLTIIHGLKYFFNIYIERKAKCPQDQPHTNIIKKVRL